MTSWQMLNFVLAAYRKLELLLNLPVDFENYDRSPWTFGISQILVLGDAAGCPVAGEMVMSQWSALSAYPTAGEPPRASQPAAVKDTASAKPRKKEKPKKAALPEKPELSAAEVEQLKKARLILYIHPMLQEAILPMCHFTVSLIRNPLPPALQFCLLLCTTPAAPLSRKQGLGIHPREVQDY